MILFHKRKFFFKTKWNDISVYDNGYLTDSITVWIDGYLDHVAVDESSASNKITSGHIGLRVRNATAYFDDIRVETFSEAQYIYNDTNGSLLHELDRDGDVTAITDEDGVVVARFSYDPWGVPTEYNENGEIVEIGSWSGTPSDGLFFLFGGMLYDALAGIYLTKTRAYDPKRGRFLQRDILDEDKKDGYRGFPFGQDAIGTNLYAWCKNNPVNRIDPSGEWSWRSVGRFLGALVGSRFGLTRLGARIGSAIGSRADYYSGYYGIRWGRNYSGGGYGWAGHARRAAEKRQPPAPTPPPKVVSKVATIIPTPDNFSIMGMQDLGFIGNRISGHLDSGFEKGLFANYWNSGGDLTLTKSRFDDIIRSCEPLYPVERLPVVKLSNGKWGKKQTYNCGGSSEYNGAMGTFTVYIGAGGTPVGLYDQYDFDSHGGILVSDRGWQTELSVQLTGASGFIHGASNYVITYGATEIQ